MSDLQANHFLVGLGGTGGKVLRSFRKTIYQNYRKDSPDGINLGYLYVDSNESMMALDDPTWKILGTNVQLQPSSQLKIAGLNLGDVLDNVTSYPGIAPWIGSRDRFQSILRGADSANVLGGQKRILGRFLFACQATHYRQRMQAIVRDLQVGNTTNVTFHFVLGLAGGTGSGALVDAICQTRALFPTPEYRIIIYALLPDKNPKPNRAGANYHANGYAALLELNALDVGTYLPIDVSAVQKERLDLKDPFNLCYLFTDENEDKNRVDIDTELPDIVSSFLVQKIVNTKDLLWKSTDGDSIKRQERFELGSQADEKEKSPSSGKPLRTRRFFTFGAKQIAYPEEEIREFLTYTFAQQAALQLQFNNFSESVGYIDQPLNLSFSEYARSPENLKRWLLADENLTLSEGILPDERANARWKPISKFWQDLLPPMKTTVQETHSADQTTWLSELYKLFNLSFEQNYRELGVKRFYEVKRGEQRDYCRQIRKTVELDLFGDVLNGTRSVYDVARLLEALLASLAEKRFAFEQAITKNSGDEKQANAQVNQNGSEWARIGFLAQMFGRRKQLFEAHGEAVRQLFTLRTQTEGLSFARSLIDAVIAEITDLANEVGRMAATISSANNAFASSIAERIDDAGQSNVQAQVVRFYKPDVVRDFAKTMVRNEQQQKLQAAAVRTALAGALGETPSFTTFNSRVKEQTFRDIVEQKSEQDVVIAHDAIVSADNTRDRVLNVNVLERLEKEYGGNREALRSYISQIVSKAKDQIVFSGAEVSRAVPGNDSLGPMFRYSTVIIPEGKDQPDFRRVVVEEVMGALTSPGEIVSNPKRPNEITILNVTSAFPARFVQDVQFLKGRYDARVDATDGEQARFELHTEGDGREWPPLFLRKITREDVLPLVLVANGLGLVSMLEDPLTGNKAAYLLTKDSSGRDNTPTKLGRDLSDAAESVDPMVFDALETNVKARLATDYLHRDKRTELYSSVRKAVDEVTSSRTNPLDPLRQAYVAADRSAENLLELSN